MNIGLIDADLLDNGTRHPNLALMKLSGYYKSLSCKVTLLTNYDCINEYDKVFISKVFSFTTVPSEIYRMDNVILGGTGFFEDGGKSLEDGIEHHKPDYTLYNNFIDMKIKQGKKSNYFLDYQNYSIGFTTRGCFRKCSFCVNKKYDRVMRHSPLAEFYDESKPYIYLWDDNFLAYGGWEEVLDELESTGKPFQFRQGLDLRLMTEKKAKRLASVKYHGDFIFAFDHIEDRDIIEEKLRLWKRYSTKTTKLYVLCGYDSQDENDIINTFERIKILMKYGCLPYIMRYEDYNDSDYRSIYIQLARWCNQPQFFKKKSFRQFCETNQVYHKNAETNCSAYQALVDFELQHPDIAKMYFDLRFDEENEYGDVFGYGRRYSYKQDCLKCRSDQKMWLDAYRGLIRKEDVLKYYFTKEMDLQCLTHPDSLCDDVSTSEIANWFINLLKNSSIKMILSAIEFEDLEPIVPSNIPQYSKFEDAVITVVEILNNIGDTKITYDDMGYYLDGKSKNVGAQKKYGENHSKFATLLDLASIIPDNKVMKISSSVLGREFIKLNDTDKKIVLTKLILRIPIIQRLLLDAQNAEVILTDYMDGLAENTRIRRKSNVSDLINFISNNSDDDINYIINAIKGV